MKKFYAPDLKRTFHFKGGSFETLTTVYPRRTGIGGHFVGSGRRLYRVVRGGFETRKGKKTNFWSGCTRDMFVQRL